MTVYGLPLFLEDKTGLITHSEFSDIYDRHPHFQVSQAAASHTHHGITHIFQLGAFSLHQSGQSPSAILEYGVNRTLGTITLGRGTPLAMDRYLTRVGGHGSSLIRQFRASDGIDYMWGFHTLSDQEWTCTNVNTQELVAHYDLKPPGEPAYTTSGNVLTVYEEFQNLALEFLASLLIMRHILQYRL